MKIVFAAPDPLLVNAVSGFLESRGIKACVLGQHKLSTAGLIPLNEAWLEVRIFDDAAEAEALELVRQFTAGGENSLPTWRCPRCGEELSGQATDCWRCATPPATGPKDSFFGFVLLSLSVFLFIYSLPTLLPLAFPSIAAARPEVTTKEAAFSILAFLAAALTLIQGVRSLRKSAGEGQ